MRGSDERTGSLFSYVDLEARVRKDHPLRTIRLIVNETLAAMERDFATLYSRPGRTLDAPGELVAGRRCCTRSIQCASERQLMERFQFDPLVPLVAGIGFTTRVGHLGFSKDPDRFVEAPSPAVLANLLATERNGVSPNTSVHCPLPAGLEKTSAIDAGKRAPRLLTLKISRKTSHQY